MAVNEVSGFLKYKDPNGDINLLMPITTKDNVDGLDEIEESLNQTVKFTAQSLTDEQKEQARSNIGVSTPDWNAAEGTPGYVKNRTHYDESKEIVVLDVNLSNPTVDNGRNATIFETDKIILEAGKTYYVVHNGETSQSVAKQFNDEDCFYMGNRYAFIGNNDVQASFGVWVEDGITRVADYNMSETCSIKIYYVEKTIKQLDPKFLPDGVPYLEGDRVEVLPECKPIYDDSEMFIIENVSPDLEVGSNYTVCWNGVEYNCVSLDSAALGEGAGGYVFGDVYTLTGGQIGTVPTGEPFVIMFYEGTCMINAMDGCTELTLSIYKGYDAIRKLDYDLLPDGVPYSYVSETVEVFPLTYIVTGFYFDGVSTKFERDVTGLDLSTGDNCTVIISKESDSIKCNLTVKEANNSLALGNTGKLGYGDDTGEKFCIFIESDNLILHYFEAATELGVSITKEVKAINALSEECLPDSAATKEYVDNKLLDLEWLPNYIKEPANVVFDDAVQLGTSKIKVFEYVPFRINVGEKYRVTWNDKTYEVIGRSQNITFNNGPATYVYLGNTAVGAYGDAVVEDTGEDFIYHYYIDENETALLGQIKGTVGDSDNTLVIAEYVSVPNKMPVKFLPDSVPYVYDGVATILPESTIATEADLQAIPRLGLVVGNTYIVTFNGTDYTCVAFIFDLDGTPLTALGNTMPDDGEDNGIPFTLVELPQDIAPTVGVNVMIDSPSGGITIPFTISIRGDVSVVHKLDNRCLDLEWIPTRHMVDGDVCFESTYGVLNTNVDSRTFIPEPGKPYRVTYGDKSFVSAAKNYADGGSTYWYIGNMNLKFSTFADTGEPAVYFITTLNGSPNTDGLVTNDEINSDTIIRICEVINEPNKIPTEFLPDISHPLYNTGIVTEGDGAAYTATIEGVTELTPGLQFVMVPHTTSTTNSVTLNVNGLGAKLIRQRLSTNTSIGVVGSVDNWIVANKPVTVTYNGQAWMVEITRPDAANLYGTVKVENGGVPSTSGADTNALLTNVDGVPTWIAAVEPLFGELSTGSDTLTWDGNREGLVRADDYDQYLISTSAPTLDDFENGASNTKLTSGNQSTTNLGMGTAIYEAGDGCIVVGNSVVALKDGATMGGTTYPKKGTYFTWIGNDSYTMSLTINGYNGFPTTKLLDEKYLPESVESVIIRSSTPGSTKRFRLTIDDFGTISATEVTE